MSDVASRRLLFAVRSTRRIARAVSRARIPPTARSRGPCPRRCSPVNLRHGIAAAALLVRRRLHRRLRRADPWYLVRGRCVRSPPSARPSPRPPQRPLPRARRASSTSSSPTRSSSPTTTATVEDSSVRRPRDGDAGGRAHRPGRDHGDLAAEQLHRYRDPVRCAVRACPTVDETAPLEEFRIAYRDYYASLADTLLGMTERMSVLDPPTVDGGQALHDGYLTYLIGLADISGGGAIAIDAAPDADSIAAIVDQIQFETEQLGESDFGLADFQGAELQALMAQVPACQDLLAS